MTEMGKRGEEKQATGPRPYPMVACYACGKGVPVGAEYHVSAYWALALGVRDPSLCEGCTQRLERVAKAIEPEAQARIARLAAEAVVTEVAKIRKEART